MGRSAFSEDGKYFSQIGSDGRCKIWDTETNILKQEFTPDLHLSTPLSCLYWIQLDDGTATPRWKNRKRKSSKPDEDDTRKNNSSHIAFGTTSGKVIIYSLAQGQIETIIEDNSGEPNICCLDWSRRHGLVTCSVDSSVKEWSIAENVVKSRFKLSKFDKSLQTKVTAIKLLDNYIISDGADSPRLLLTASCQIKLWSLTSKTILRTLTGHSTDVVHLEVVSFPQEEKCYVLSGSKNDRILSFWNINLTNEELSTQNGLDSSSDVKTPRKRRSSARRNSLGGHASQITSACCSLLMEEVAVQTACCRLQGKRNKPGLVQVVAVTRSGVAHYYEHTLNESSTKPIRPSTTIQVALEEADGSVKPAPICCGSLQDKLLVGYSTVKGVTFERLVPDVTEKTQVLVRSSLAKSKKEALRSMDEDITKIRRGDAHDPSVVHLDAQVNGDVKAGKRGREAKQDVPMESRLANLSLAGVAGQGAGPGKQAPPSNNMAQLLVQALHSKDAKLLSTVFECRDPEVAYNSISRLPIQYVSPLMDHLTTMVMQRTNQCMSGCVWSSALCLARSSALLSCGGARSLLTALQQRRAALPHLLHLRGRLQLLTDTVQRSAAHTEGEPALQYADSSSEDEMGDEDMEEALKNNADDDSASWNEEDDEENSSAVSDQEMSE